MKKTVVELFAGVGGFHAGLKQAGDFEVIWANQWEPNKKVQHAFDCYKSHFGNKTECVNEDISKVKHQIPEHTLLVGGFPCQDYSVASTGAKGIKGVKGVLWWEIRDILEAKRPPFVLLENVDRLLKSPAKQRGRDFSVILSTLNELGYNVEWRVLNAAEYGFAQRRRRVFIFAYHNETEYSKRIDSRQSYDVIANDGIFAKQFKIHPEFSVSEVNLDLMQLLEISDSFSYQYENSGYMKNGIVSTAKTVPIQIKPIPLRDIMVKTEVDAKYFLQDDEEKWNYLKDKKRIERTSKSGHKYTFSEGKIAYPDPIDKPARTMLTSEASINRSTHVVLDLITNKKRLLTPEECELLNGFESGWTDTGMPHKFRYFCMGNALVVNIIEALGFELIRIIEKETMEVKIVSDTEISITEKTQ